MNKFFAGLGGGSGLGAAAVASVVIMGGVALMQFGRSSNEAAVTPAVQPAPSTESALVQPQQAAPTVQAEETAPPAPMPPAFDEVRREEDGTTVLAGRAAPGAIVSVLLDGEAIAEVRADGAGKFATLTSISPDGKGHVLTLLQVADGAELLSEDQIILAPLAAPVAVAKASPEEVVVEENTIVAETAQPAQPGAEAVAVTNAPQLPGADAPVPTGASDSVTAALATDQPVELATAPAAPPRNDEAALVEQATEETVASDSAAPAEEPAQVAVLKATEDGVELLNTPAPKVLDNVELDTISYSDVGEVQLAGRAQEEADAVRVYLDNNTVATLPVDEEGRWRGDLPEVDQGVYTLRLDEVASDGSVTSRVETPFKREDPAVLAAASAAEDGLIKAITVQKGATLWAIARDRYGEGELYVRVFEANRASIKDPDLIYPGQIFDLPD